MLVPMSMTLCSLWY